MTKSLYKLATKYQTTIPAPPTKIRTGFTKTEARELDLLKIAVEKQTKKSEAKTNTGIKDSYNKTIEAFIKYNLLKKADREDWGSILDPIDDEDTDSLFEDEGDEYEDEGEGEDEEIEDPDEFVETELEDLDKLQDISDLGELTDLEGLDDLAELEKLLTNKNL